MSAISQSICPSFGQLALQFPTRAFHVLVSLQTVLCNILQSRVSKKGKPTSILNRDADFNVPS
jgi:hypothetical protein